MHEGLSYRKTLINWVELGYSNSNDIVVDTEKFYHNVMNRFKFGGLKDNPNYYSDETISRMVYTHRRVITSLATELYNEGKKEKALNLLNLIEEELPSSIVPHNPLTGGMDIGRLYIAMGEYDKGLKIIRELLDVQMEYINWYSSLNGSRFNATMQDSYMAFEIAKIMIEELKEGDETCKAAAADYNTELSTLFNAWKQRLN